MYPSGCSADYERHAGRRTSTSTPPSGRFLRDHVPRSISTHDSMIAVPEPGFRSAGSPHPAKGRPIRWQKDRGIPRGLQTEAQEHWRVLTRGVVGDPNCGQRLALRRHHQRRRLLCATQLILGADRHRIRPLNTTLR